MQISRYCNQHIYLHHVPSARIVDMMVVPVLMGSVVVGRPILERAPTTHGVL